MIMDGTSGRIQLDPDEAAQQQAREQQRRERERREAAERMAQNPAVTRDGHRVEVAATSAVEQAALACSIGAEGRGLMRTEFLFLDRATPPRRGAVAAYRPSQKACGRRSLFAPGIGDKPCLYSGPRDDTLPGRARHPPVLNRRSCCASQLRAILRAAAYGHLPYFPCGGHHRCRRPARCGKRCARSWGREIGKWASMWRFPPGALMADLGARGDFSPSQARFEPSTPWR